MAAVLLAAVLAQAPGPASLTLPAYRLHLRVDESVDADALRSLVGSGTVLWLGTRSNMLRDSTVEALAGFPEAWVQLRPPLLDAHVRQLARAPRAGVWLDAGTSGTSGWHHPLGPRRVAVDVRGVLDVEVASRVAALRPARVTWFPTAAEATLAGWGELVQLPGTKLLVLTGAGDVGPPGSVEAADRRDARAPSRTDGVRGPCSGGLPGPWKASSARVSLWMDGAAWRGGGPCGSGRRIQVRELLDEASLLALFLQDPATELELEVGADPEALARARAWVERLEAAVSGSAR